MSRVRALTIIVLGTFCSAAAQATTTILETTLSGAHEVPGNASPGTGEARVTFDDVADTLRVEVTFAGLTGATTASHIHCCTAPGANAMVATAVPTFPGFPTGVFSGAYDQTFSLLDAAFYNPAFVTAHGGTIALARADFLAGLLGGDSYLNIHSTAFAGGEIRGQLTVVPEPALWAMLLLGFGLTGVMARRRFERPVGAF